MREGSLWRWYLRERGPFLLVLCLFAGIFALVFGLYGFSLRIVAYPALLCLLLALVLLGLDAWHYRSRHRQRQALLENIELNLNRLPPPETLAEAELGEMLQALGALRRAQITASRAQEQESLDYYAAWVHQIKTPIAAMGMLLQGEDSEEHRALRAELFRIEQYVEMVLSYLRLRGEGTDFVFREVELDGVIRPPVCPQAHSLPIRGDGGAGAHRREVAPLYLGAASLQRHQIYPQWGDLHHRPGQGPDPSGQRHGHRPGGPAPDL